MMDQLSFKALRPKEGTVRYSVLHMLEVHPYGLCREDFVKDHIYEVSARVGELQKMGWVITTAPCLRHHHQSRIVQYQLAQE